MMNPRQLRQTIERERKSSAEASYDTRRKVIDWLKQNQGATLDDATISMLEAILQPPSIRSMKDTRKHPNEQAECAYLDACWMYFFGEAATSYQLGVMLDVKQGFIDKWRKTQAYPKERAARLEQVKKYGGAMGRIEWVEKQTDENFTTKP